MLLWPLLLTLSTGFVVLGWFVVDSVRSDAVERIDDELRRLNEITTPAGVPGAGVAAPDRPGPFDGPDGDENRAGGGNLEQARSAIDRPVVVEISGDEIRTLLGPNIRRPDDRVLRELRQQTDPFTIDDPGGGAGFRALIRRAPGQDAFTVAVIGLEDVDDTIARVRRSLFIGALAVFFIQALAVWLVTRRISRPIGDVATAASRIADGHLDTQIPTSERPLETAELASSVGVMVDQLRATIDRAELSADEATAARDQMQRFLADASHELRTPLTSIGGYAQLHNRGMLDGPELDQAMVRVESESARLSRLVDDMLALARGLEQSYDPAPVDLAPLVAGVAEDLRAAHPDRIVEFDSADAATTHVTADSDQLHQAILNLGKNALEHSPADAAVTLAVTNGNSHVTIDVIDHGEGIAPADAERIFEAFYRADSSRYRSENQTGAGLGLAITKMIAERHQARLDHTPTPGGGTTFSLALPA